MVYFALNFYLKKEVCMYNLMLFPGKDDLQAFLASHDLLNTQYLQEKGLTKKLQRLLQKD